MRKKEFRKRKYVTPAVKIIETEVGHQLLNGSFTNGGHNQGHVGPGGGDAKQGWFDEDEDEVTSNLTSEGERNYQSWNE